MSAPIPSQTRFPTANQNPSNSILDAFDKQTYLGNQFSIVGPVGPPASVETPYLLISNPSTSPKSLFVNFQSWVDNDVVLVNIYANPTVLTNGTPITPVNMRVASATTSHALCYGDPTTSSFGTLISSTGTIYSSTPAQLMIIVDPGVTLLYTLNTLSAGDPLAAQIGWYEL
jgi:hypothetical protein